MVKDQIARERAEEARELEVIEDALTEDPWGASLHAVGCGLSDRVPAMLYRAWTEGRVEDLERALQAVWVHNPAPLRGLGERRWLEMFKEAGFVVVTEAKARLVEGNVEDVPGQYEHRTEQPTEPIEVWRGAAITTKGRGMSWSVHRDCARDFADGVANLGREAGVFRAVVPPQAVLGFFGDEREQEAVVNPNMLRGRVQLDETVPAVEIDSEAWIRRVRGS